MKKILGKTVLCFRGFMKRDGKVSLSYILFDDHKTYLQLEEQDRYDYHDCNSSARVIEVREDASMWKALFDKVAPYEESTEDDF
jgi:hypothetical protein